MRIVSDATTAAWLNPVKAGDTRPWLRATVQDCSLQLTPYNTQDAPGGDYDHERDRQGHFSNILFGSHAGVRELRGILSFSNTRDVTQDTADATLTLANTDVAPIGNPLAQSDDFDNPGIYTYNRGTSTIETNPWGYTDDTGWINHIAPDRLVKTYQGYGVDPDVPPGDDTNLYLTGIWLIDTVTLSAQAQIVIRMRDLGRLLLDQISFPPVVPYDDYPMAWEKIQSVEVPARGATGGSWNAPHGSATSSNQAYVGHGITDTPTYVGVHGGVQGHNDGDPLRRAQGSVPEEDFNDTYWYSTGQDTRDSTVWWQVNLTNPQDIASVKIQTYGGPYRLYVSLHRDGDWVGKRKVPYQVTTEDINNGAKISYVHSELAERGQPFEVVLPRIYHNVTKVRITMTRLRRLGGDSEKHPWHAGLRWLKLYTGATGFDATGHVVKPVGNYADWTDVVKWVLAWCGWWWPGSEQNNWIRYSTEGDLVHYEFPSGQGDAILPKGRVWGSFQKTNTGGIATATPDQFDKQEMVAAINYVKNIVGFLGFVDECGGYIWRMPNIYAKGNYINPDHKHSRWRPVYEDQHLSLNEGTTLLDYQTVLDSKNLRERIFVANSTGKVGTVVRGYAPYDTGMRRVAGWTDEHFETNRECRVAADMIAAQQLFSWRTSSVTMHGHPGVQLDDQIRIYERVTNETFYHYVQSIQSDYDALAGTWTYNLTTHWLGERISDAWVVRVDQLDAATQAYLGLLGTVD